MKINYKFACPECGNSIIEEVLEGVTQTSTITDMELIGEDIIMDYGDYSTEGGDFDSIRYQCMICGYNIDINTLTKIITNKGE